MAGLGWVIRAGVAEQGSGTAGGSAFMGLLSLVPGLCLGSSWPESVPHIRISPPALIRGHSGWGEVFYPGAAAIPSPAWQERAHACGLLRSCTRCFHTRRILEQKKGRKSSQTGWCHAGHIAQGSSGLCHINLLRPSHHPASHPQSEPAEGLWG